MQQRQLRLGDVLDDYCPRERRITNHAIVALVGDEIRLTRCTTCDAEHEYKQARIPPQRKKKDVQGVLYQQVLSGMPRKAGPAALLGEETPEDPPLEISALPEPPAESEPAVVEDPEEGPVHRRLIRATLPRIEGQEPPARREPDFTIRQQVPGRGGRFGNGPGRGGHQRFGGQHANGNRGGKRHGHSGGQRPSGGRPSHQGVGNRQRQGGPGGKKRSR